MKNKLSKWVALVAVLISLIGGTPSVSGVSRTRPIEGDLTIHKYWAKTDDDIGTADDGEAISGINVPPAAGIQFDVYELTPETGAPTRPPSEKDGWEYSRAGKELTVRKGAAEHKYRLVLKESDAGIGGKTNAAGELKYSDLSAGYYYVEEELAATMDDEILGTGTRPKTMTTTAKPFVTAIPMRRATGNDWNTDIHVYPKEQGLNPKKRMETPSVTVGDNVEWTITTNIPADITDYQQFDVVDKLDKRLDCVSDSIRIVGLDSKGAEVETLINEMDFNLASPSISGLGKEPLLISLTSDGIKKLGTTPIVQLVISFATTVNGNSAHDSENSIENNAMITFSNGLTTDTEQTPSVAVHTGTIKINKTYSGEIVDESAQFQLAQTNEEAEDGEYLRVVLDEEHAYIKDIVIPGEPGYDAAYRWIALPTEADETKLGFKTDTFFVRSFEGLKTCIELDGVKTFETYYLMETQVPEGYSWIENPFEVTFTGSGKDTNYVHITDEIKNRRSFTLPNTGGFKTFIPVVAGSLFIGIVILLAINKKKKSFK